MTDIEPHHIAEQDQARAAALLGAPILMAAYQIAESHKGTDAARKLLLDECVKSNWSALEAMALAVEMMRRASVAEREHKALRAAIEAEQTNGAPERQAVVGAARAWYEGQTDNPNDWAGGLMRDLLAALEALPDPPTCIWER